MLLSSELCKTLVIQRDFYTSIIVIVAFDAGIEAGSINYLPYIVLHVNYTPLQGDESKHLKKSNAACFYTPMELKL